MEHLWREVTSGELFASALHLSPARIREAAGSARDVGNALKDVWKNADDTVRKALDLPVVEHRVSPHDRDHIVAVARTVGYGVGFAGAGVLGAAGAYKIASAIRHRSRAQLLDGLVDLGAGAAVAASVAAWAPGGLLLGPAAAALGIVRGGYNAWHGYRSGQTRNEIQGFLDAGNNAVAFSRLIPALATGAMLLAPLAAGVQLCRGGWDLSRGIAEGSNEKKVQGLADVCAAVGLALSAAGPLAVPGVALVGVGSAVKVLYQFSPTARKKLDHAVERATPRLQPMMEKVEARVAPLLARARAVIEKVTGHKRGDEPAPPAP
jgi:hypothetical protein